MATVCSSCGAEIIWAESPSGKQMPLDAAITRVWLQGYGPQGKGGARLQWRQVEGHVAHFANCPNAVKHRKPKGDAC